MTGISPTRAHRDPRHAGRSRARSPSVQPTVVGVVDPLGEPGVHGLQERGKRRFGAVPAQLLHPLSVVVLTKTHVWSLVGMKPAAATIAVRPLVSHRRHPAHVAVEHGRRGPALVYDVRARPGGDHGPDAVRTDDEPGPDVETATVATLGPDPSSRPSRRSSSVAVTSWCTWTPASTAASTSTRSINARRGAYNASTRGVGRIDTVTLSPPR